VKLFLAIAAGGAMGAVARHLLVQGAGLWAGPGFPWGVLLVNILGAFLAGAATQLLSGTGPEAQLLRAGLMTGALGGLTTFSAFTLDIADLGGRGQVVLAFLYILLSVAGALAALLAGMLLARQLSA